MFLEISQNSQENTYARVNFIKKETLTQVFSCKFCEISKSTCSYRTPPLAASAGNITHLCALALLSSEDSCDAAGVRIIPRRLNMKTSKELGMTLTSLVEQKNITASLRFVLA